MSKEHVINQNMEMYAVGTNLHNHVEIKLVLILMEVIMHLVINKKMTAPQMVWVDVLRLLIAIYILMLNHALLD